MKKAMLFCLLACAGIVSVHAQSLVDSALRYLKPTLAYDSAIITKINGLLLVNPVDTTEGGNVNATRRLLYYRERTLTTNVPADSDMLLPYRTAITTAMTYPNTYCTGTGDGHWQCLGPYVDDYGGHENLGRVNAVWVSPHDTNYILAASYGGVWRSTTGGHSWHNISDFQPTGYGGVMIPGTMGITSMAVDPLDSSIIYLHLSDLGGTCFGTVYTTNGGSTWQSDTAFNRLSGFVVFNGYPAVALKYMPGTQKLFARVSSQILVKNNPFAAWTDITPGGLGVDAVFTDMDFTIASPGKVVVSTIAPDDTGHLLTYDTVTSAWNNLKITMPSTSDTITNIDAISISATDSVFMFVRVKNEDQQLVATPLSSLRMSVLNTSLSYFGPFEHLLVSPNNTQVMYASVHDGYYNFYQSTNRGADHFYVDLEGSTHADGRFISMYKAGAAGGGLYDDVLYGGTDGGVIKKRMGINHFESITGDSLCITQIWGLSNMEGEDDLIMGGAQDNGRIAYNKNRPVQWNNDDGQGDNIWPKFLRNGVRSAYEESDFFNTSYENMYEIDFGATTESVVHIDYPTEGNPINWYRPWYIDNNNTAYVDYNTVWKRAPGGSWLHAFNAFPTFPNPNPNGGILNSIIEAEPDTNFFYLAYGGVSRNDTELSGSPNEWGRIFKSFNALSTDPSHPPVWTSITPHVVGSFGIQCVEIDKQHPGRIWIGLTGVERSNLTNPDSSINRIFYSPDTGRTWIDVSSGLPPLVVTKIKYRRGSKDDIYCSTSFGVYRCDFSTFDPSRNFSIGDGQYRNRSVQWHCFNNGMPNCEVTDMEFNYCSNKLRVSTMGRGIWETSLDSSEVLPDTLQTVIFGPGTTTWNTNKYLETSVDIQPGATLNITGDTVFMPKGAAIIVEPGAHLVVNHAEITNSCAQCFWYGIQAKGNTGLPQSTTNDGWVTIQNGSTLSHAFAAVSNDAGVPGTSGGIIQATGSYFVNNQYDAYFSPYSHIDATTGLLLRDVSHFFDCTFLLDNSYKGNTTGTPAPSSRVSLNGVDGISFLGCQFLNRDTFAVFRRAGDGIHAYGASFHVANYCSLTTPGCPSAIGTRFCGFTNGIWTGGTPSGQLTTSIDQTAFDTTSVGVNVQGYTNVATTRCNFKIGHGNPVIDVYSHTAAPGCYQNIGILAQNADQFKMEQNVFEGSVLPPVLSPWYNFGVVADNCWGTSSNIYRNTLDSLTYGVFAIGDNYGLGGLGGSPSASLHILCNTFSKNTHDIVVADDGSSVSPQGIGTQGRGIDTAAGNTFTTTSGVTNIVNSTSLPFIYIYGTGAGENPTVSSASLVIKSPAAYAASCPSSIGPSPAPMPVADPTTLELHKARFRIYRTNWLDTAAVYNSRIDFGNTATLIARIDTSTDTVALYNTLSSGSPYISAAALTEVAAKKALLLYSMMNTLLKNPDNLRDNNFLMLIQSAYSLNSTQLGILKAKADTITARTKQEINIQGLLFEAENEANTILSALKSPVDTSISMTDTTWAAFCSDSESVYFQLDSNQKFVWLDSTDVWLQNIGELWTQYERVGMANFLGQTTTANNIFQGIAGNLPANSTKDTAEYADYARIWGAVYDAAIHGRTIFDLDSAEIAGMDTTGTWSLSYDLPDLMIASYSIIHPSPTPAPPVPTPTFFPCLSASDPRPGGDGNNTQPGNIPGSNNKFTAYPNPANGTVTFAYNVSTAGGDIAITITNILGEKIAEMHTGNNSGNTYWEPGNISSGIYIYTASGAKGKISMGKIVIIR